MRIACPTCAAAYEVPDAILAAGPRLLRCARCSTEFPAALPEAEARPQATTVADPAPDPIPEPSAEPPPRDASPAPDPMPPSPEPAPDLAVAPRDRPPPTRGPAVPSPIEPPEPPAASGQGALAAAWMASVAAIAAGVFALLHWQAEIAAAWPPAARLYAALGLS